MARPRIDRIAVVGRVNADDTTDQHSHVILLGRNFQANSKIEVAVSSGTNYDWRRVGTVKFENPYLIQKFKIVAPAVVPAAAAPALFSEETGQVTITVTNLNDFSTSNLEGDARYVAPAT